MVRTNFPRAAAAITVGLIPIFSAFSQGSTYEAAAFAGQGAPGGGTFAGFDTPRIGADGTLGFVSWLGNERSVLIKGRAGSLARVAMSGDSAPGGGKFDGFGPLSVSKDGLLAYRASIFEGESLTEGLWIEGAGAAGVALTVVDFGFPAFRAGTVLSIKARIEAPRGQFDESYQDVLLLGAPGHVNAVLNQGDPAPGFPAGATIRSLLGYESAGPGLDMNESGAVALKAIVRAVPSGTPVQREAIYAGSPADLRLVAAEGRAAPGIPDGVVASLSSEPSIASNGLVAFSAHVEAGEGGSLDAVFAGSPTAVEPIVRTGSQVPTAPEGVVFRGFHRTAINETGDVVFGATIEYPDETTREGIWIKRQSGAPVLIAISGIALDSPDGPVELHSVDFAGPGSFNDLHQFVFRASTGNGGGVYVADTRPGIPWLRLTQPRNRHEQVTQARVARIAGRAIDDTGIESVEYTVTPLGPVDGAKKKRTRVTRGPRLAKGDRNWSFDVPLAMGRNRISIVATDKLGNVSEPIEFTMIRWAPSVGSANGKKR